MKKTILIIMFILCLPLVYSLYGGETWNYHFNECDTLEVNITGTDTIDEGEYTILNNCTKNQTNYYICGCEDNYDFNVTFKINTVNNYTFDFNYMYETLVQEQSSGSSGGSGGSRSGGSFTIRFDENKSRTLMLKKNILSRFWVNGEQHTIEVVNIFNDSVRVEIKSVPQIKNLFLNSPSIIDIDGEQLELTLTEIRGNVVFIKFEKLQSNNVPPTITDANETVGDIVEEPIDKIEITLQPEQQEEPKIKWGLLITIVIILVIGIVCLIVYGIKKGKKQDEK